RGGRASTRVEYWHMVIKLGDELLGGVLRAIAQHDAGPGGQKAQLAVARSFGAGRDNFDAFAHQVGPVLDLLGVAAADDEYNRREIRQRTVGQAFRPVALD